MPCRAHRHAKGRRSCSASGLRGNGCDVGRKPSSSLVRYHFRQYVQPPDTVTPKRARGGLGARVGRTDGDGFFGPEFGRYDTTSGGRQLHRLDRA